MNPIRKRLSILLPLLLLASAPAAQAFFEEGKLIQVVYKKGDAEVATDLGIDVMAADWNAPNQEISPAGTVRLDQFPTATTWENIKLAFFAFVQDEEASPMLIECWIASTRPAAPRTSENGITAFFSAATSVQNTCRLTGNGQRSVVGSSDAFKSYNRTMNSNGTTPGYYGGYNDDFIYGEANLGAFAGAEFVDMYLFHFGYDAARDELNRLKPGPGGREYKAVLRLYKNGRTVLNPPSAAVPPVIAAVGDASITEGAAYGLTPALVQGTAPVTWSLVAGPAGMSVDPGTGRVSWPSPTAAGSPHRVKIRAANAAGFDEKEWRVQVAAAAVPPVIAAIGDAAVGDGEAYVGPAPRLLQGTPPVVWSLVQGPAGMTIDPSSGVVSWPRAGAAGSPHRITIQAANAAGTGAASWTLAVAAVAPAIAAIPDGVFLAGSAYTGPVPVLTQGTPPVAWSLAAGPAGMTIDPSTGVVSWASASAAGSPHLITIRATNGAGSAEESWRLAVESQAAPPLLDPIPDAQAPAGVPFTRPAPNLSRGTPPIAWSLSAGPAGMTIDPATGTLSWPSPTAAGSPHAVTVQAANSAGTDRQSFRLTVVNQAPSAPSVHAPFDGGETASRRPTLTVNNASDPEGAPLTCTFELYADPELATRVDSAGGVPQGAGTTSWTVSVLLNDNTLYHWRARASDGMDASPWMPAASFFVNTANDPPGAPAIGAPSGGAAVPGPRPLLEAGNASDPDRDPLTYEFEVYADPALSVRVAAKAGILQGAGGKTAWQVDASLEEERTYFWRVRAVDRHGLAGPWSDAAAFQVVTAAPPAAPLPVAPADGSETAELQPELVVRNSPGARPERPVYYFEVDRLESFNGTERQRSEAVAEHPSGRTSFRPAALAENTEYFWRAKAVDGRGESPWVVSAFFVNAVNDPPETPAVENPSDRGQIPAADPTLAVHPARDPDRDLLAYEFELYADARGQTLLGSRKTRERFWLVALPLKGETRYFWRVRATDEHGASSPWSPLSSFTVKANVAPEPPAPNNPVSGGTVASLNPTLSVFNSRDANGDELRYEFELYADRDLFRFIASAEVRQQNEITAWKIEPPLEDGAVYYWRARARDGFLKSGWMPTARFTVALSGAETVCRPVVQREVDAAAPEAQFIEVADPESPLSGLSIEIPPGALGADLTITVGVVENPPALPPGTKSAGCVLHFGPEGARFLNPLIVRIPYAEEELERAGVSDPAQLVVLTFAAEAMAWRTLPVAAVLREARLLVFEVDHFSMFTTGAAAAVEPPQAGGGGGGSGGSGGGCFIAAARPPGAGPGGLLCRAAAAAGLAALLPAACRRKVRPPIEKTNF
jgi:hypothetical protein